MHTGMLVPNLQLAALGKGCITTDQKGFPDFVSIIDHDLYTPCPANSDFGTGQRVFKIEVTCRCTFSSLSDEFTEVK